MFVIDRQRFILAVEQAQANVAQSQSTLKLAGGYADRDATVMSSDSGAISAQIAETSRAKASEATAALQLAQSQFATAQLNLERSTMHSPVNGFVTNLTATVGDYATTGTGVLALVDRDSFYVYAYFMETKLPAIKIGSEAEVRLMAGGIVLRGKVQGFSRAIANPRPLVAACSPRSIRISSGSVLRSASRCVSPWKTCPPILSWWPACPRPSWSARLSLRVDSLRHCDAFTFDLANGCGPSGGLIQANNGDFYGVTTSGGSGGICQASEGCWAPFLR